MFPKCVSDRELPFRAYVVYLLFRKLRQKAIPRCTRFLHACFSSPYPLFLLYCSLHTKQLFRYATCSTLADAYRSDYRSQGRACCAVQELCLMYVHCSSSEWRSLAVYITVHAERNHARYRRNGVRGELACSNKYNCS
jgi:hypothetical protein